jgi:tRNA pseudouridine38-40 synthase
MARYFVELSYDGTNYHGWQVQPNAVTVQQTLEKAFSTLLKEDISLTGCGRTDTGVHASYFVAHFDSEQAELDHLADRNQHDDPAQQSGLSQHDDPVQQANLPQPDEPLKQSGPAQPGNPAQQSGPARYGHPAQRSDLVFRLNGYLPDDIAIRSIKKVDSAMHARFSATYRKYIYVIRKTKPLFSRPFCYYYYADLDVEKMNAACDILREYTDFTSFSKLHTDVRTNDCKIMEAVWTAHDDGYDFTITADRFLRNMVRSIVGTMIEIGSGKMEPEEIRTVIEARDRGSAGTSAPAKGLFLVEVGY